MPADPTAGRAQDLAVALPGVPGLVLVMQEPGGMATTVAAARTQKAVDMGTATATAQEPAIPA